jgi:predicted nucleic acid-binding protein
VIVLDASAAVEFLLGTKLGTSVKTRIRGNEETLHAPHVLDLEVASALRRLVRHGEVRAARARAALDDLVRVPVTRYPHAVFLQRIWELRANASVYDAAYLALGEALSATVVTCDSRVAGIPGHAAIVEVL